MSRPVRLGVAALVALLATMAVGVLTRVPYSVGDRELAAVRLSWRMLGSPVEECRSLSAAELAELPAHMRQPEVCESYVPPYRLRVLVDGETIEDILVLAGGSRQDNPIYVYSELRVAPGPHELSVAFWQEESGAAALPSVDVALVEPTDTSAPVLKQPEDADDGAVAPGQAAGRSSGEPAPPRLELSETIDLQPGQVALVTYDREARSLIVR